MKIFISANKRKKGFTYIEALVVISIFFILTAITMADYRSFQAKIDIRNLSSDIGLTITEAQRSALSGKFAPADYTPIANWKPAHGVYFKIETLGENQKRFIYFVDLDNDNICDGCSSFPANPGVGNEVVRIIDITKGNYILGTNGLAVGSNEAGYSCGSVNELTIVYTRPDSRPIIKADEPCGGESAGKGGIFIASPSGASSSIVVERTGRIYFE